jgi:hypothetical protein
VAFTDDYSKVALYIENLVKKYQTALGLQDVFYGDMDLIPRTPAACIETGPLVRQLTGAMARVDNSFTIYIMVYHGKVQDVQLNKLQCDQFAVAIQNKLHTDLRLDDPSVDATVTRGNGLVYYGMVTGIEPGYTIRSKSLMRTSRITWEGNSKTNLGT